ncbi:HupE/UreJ family protein [Kushneria phosphatilytica]|uniref:HupE/UreJ family protein n=1 Tax=Kushneria phosphatilytica TaxID=657387 RepID=A0A1S1NSY4_9GAMM|nr:HupE/UreJ family protein [Kushneria phosphatilytica]OHV08463.1 urease accessory protein UreJ [Kushneria phosphatilytica]QEL09894.1 HupE/UreJ family protein [Kushneria phosphatilytica]
MRSQTILMATLVALLGITLATPALAHPALLPHSHGGGGFTAGLLHPLTGLDHLLAMGAIGLWSARQSATLRRWMPLLVALGMLAGAGLAWAGVPLTGVEFGIAMSVLLAGILIAAMVRLPTAAGGALVFAFILLHGHAHGSELAPEASALYYALGFLASSVTITLAGRGLGGWLARRDNRLSRVLGGVIVMAGGALALG